MCGHSDHDTRFGSALEHGDAHSRDHSQWTRRGFLRGLGLTAAGSMTFGGVPLRAFGNSLLHPLARLETDRVLVVLQLSGGNDGLNTVVPIGNDIYHTVRPTLGLSASDVLALTSELGLHPSLAPLVPHYMDGALSIVQGVGYPDSSLSHFRSTDIWMTGTDASDVGTTGWAGRYLDQVYPDFSDDPTSYPLAVQLGNAAPLLFQGPEAQMGVSIASMDLFNRISTSGDIYSTDGLPDALFGDEMRFMRSVANGSFRYASAIQTASEAGANLVEYPDGNPLSDPLAAVARMIRGRLGSRIYHVSLGSFDTHANQLNAHETLLRYVGEAMGSFMSDLATDGEDQRVLGLTFSEFGRRVQQNGSGGTDHGTAAPLFVFGSGTTGGLHGPGPNLANLDAGGNLSFATDYRSVYASLLQDWFGLTALETAALFGGSFGGLSLVADPTSTGLEPADVPESFDLGQNYPNPFNPVTTIPLRLARSAPVRIDLFDVRGRHAARILDRTLSAGNHDIVFAADRLPSGAYTYRVTTAGSVQSRTMTLIR